MTIPVVVSEGRVVAFIDIGTNSVRLLLVRIHPNHFYTILSDQKEVVRLGEGEFAHLRLHPQAMQRALLVCQHFADMARAYGAEEVIAVATSATREAVNRSEFIRRLRREAGLDVRTISGPEEARLIYLGVASGLHLESQQALFMDIGGGSTELIVGDQNEYKLLESLKLGAIRLTSLFFLPGESAPITPDRYALIQQYIRDVAVRATQRIREQSIDILIGSSGTLENLGDIAAWYFYQRARSREDTFTHKQISEVIQYLCSLSLAERRKVDGINAARADIIIAGAAILDTIMEELGLSEMQITDRGLRDGLLLDYLIKTGQMPSLEGGSVQERSVLQLGRSCGFDEGHARVVARLALELFDSAGELKLHRFGSGERQLLEYSALLHDIGVFLSYNNHQEHSYYLIRNADLLGFDQTEIEIMAAASRFHRKAFPRKKKHPEFARLDKRSRKIVKLFSVLLRIAESLDRGHRGMVTQVSFRKEKGRRVVLVVSASGDIQLEFWGLQNHRRAFKKVFDRELVFEAVQSDTAGVIELQSLKPGYDGTQAG